MSINLNYVDVQPVEYVVNNVNFFNRNYYIDNRTYISNKETELLVQYVINYVIENNLENGILVDVGTGCGNIACTLAHHFPNAKIIATDISKDALEVAAMNIRKHNIKNIELINTNLIKDIYTEPDVIVANFTSTNDSYLLPSNFIKKIQYMPKEALFHENGIFGGYLVLWNQVLNKKWKSKVFVESGTMPVNEIKTEIIKNTEFAYNWKYVVLDKDIPYSTVVTTFERPITVGFCYNEYESYHKPSSAPSDIAEEWTSKEDIQTIKTGLEEAGFKVVNIGHPKNILNNTKNVDVIFSIAEMIGYRYREGLAPSICELLNIPYTFSTPDTLMLALDKHLSNLLVKDAGHNVPTWYRIAKVSQVQDLESLKNYPYIIKPVAEGSSIGIDASSVVTNFIELEQKVTDMMIDYSQPVIVQEFVEGREITIGVLKEGEITKALSPLEFCHNSVYENWIYDNRAKRLAHENSGFNPISDKEMISLLQEKTLSIFDSFECKDTARVDFRVDKEGKIYFIEINPLTDYTPRREFCKSAFASGYTYTELLQTIIFNTIHTQHEIRK